MKFIHSDAAPAALGPYSQAVQVGQLLFVSGQLPLKDGRLIDDAAEATTAVLTNLLSIVQAAGGGKESFAKVNIFVRNMDDFDTINGAYADFFGDHKPARACVQVARLPKDAVLEIEVIADLS
ncbi:MAG: Rid family detoxifying hydrolase [Clostridia bacterium]|nr:Rid family detoxifying hydrolase [Clostridiales bacterium]MDU7504714.1 Rid family detoxifying hydrolase [Clostridia bacterium]